MYRFDTRFSCDKILDISNSVPLLEMIFLFIAGSE